MIKMNMTTKMASDIVGGLTTTSKMPCPSLSIPSSACITGAKLVGVKGSSCEGCYTLEGFYNMPDGIIARDRRLSKLYDPRWTQAMVTLIKSRRKYKKEIDVFRWHDSGDLQGIMHLSNIMHVAKLTPKCKHWLPTRENAFLKAYVESGNIVPKNMYVRVSALMRDGKPPTKFVDELNKYDNVEGFIGTSTIHHKTEAIGFSCVAYTQGGECRDCRKCWTTEENISYPFHTKRKALL
jgi:hypothetical protein